MDLASSADFAEKFKLVTLVIANIKKIQPYTRSQEMQHANINFFSTKEQGENI